MKARYRKTGEIVTIIAYSGRVDRNKILDYVYYIDSNGKEHMEDGRGLNFYWDFETEIENSSINKSIVDWPSFRREITKDILPAMVNWRRTNKAGANLLISKEEAVKFAIEYADELIKQLKQE